MDRGITHALAIGLTALILMSGCASMRPVTVREPVEVTKIVYVRVSPGLTMQCPIALPRNNSGKELLRVARERLKSLQDCNRRMMVISALEGTEVTP